MKSKLLPKLRQIVFTFQKANSMRKGMNWTLELQQRAQTFLGERDPVNSLWNLSTYIWWMWAEWQPLSAVLAAVLVRGVLYSSEESRPPCCRETGGCFRFVWPTRSVLYNSSVWKELLKPEKVFHIASSDSRGSSPPKGGWESIDSSLFLCIHP